MHADTCTCTHTHIHTHVHTPHTHRETICTMYSISLTCTHTCTQSGLPIITPTVSCSQSGSHSSTRIMQWDYSQHLLCCSLTNQAESFKNIRQCILLGYMLVHVQGWHYTQAWQRRTKPQYTRMLCSQKDQTTVHPDVMFPEGPSHSIPGCYVPSRRTKPRTVHLDVMCEWSP